VTRIRAGRPGSIPDRGNEGLFLSLPPRSDRLWNPPSFHSGELPGALSPEVKRPGPEADHSPLSSAEVKNA
jgi:hypothetical protein